MESEVVSSPSNFLKCCNCGFRCSLSAQSSYSSGVWLRSIKRMHDEFALESQFYVPGLDYDSVARVEIRNECTALRETVSSQQKAIQDLYAELEEERNAASSAANEAMSMILRLQREKAEVQMEARQFKRCAEERTLHDQEEISALEDLLYKREQIIQSLECEIQAYKYRLMSFGLTEAEADGVGVLDDQYELPPYEYPPLKCQAMHATTDADNEDTDVEKYVFGETPRDHLRNLENRISQMERTPTYGVDGDFTVNNILEKVIVGQSPRRTRHSRKFSCDSTSFIGMDSPKLSGSFRKTDYVLQSEDHSNLKKVDNASEAGDDIRDKVYTVEYSVYSGAPYRGFTESKSGAGVYEDFATTPMELGNHADFEDPYIKKLYMRLQALEADRESMRQAIISMSTDKAQLVLLKEIAQHLCKEIAPQRKMTTKIPSIVGGLSFLTVFKWITSIVFWRKKAHVIKYMFGLSSNSVGLLMLLNKEPYVRPWRCIQCTQAGD